jgi:hypothetical protein
MAGLLLGVPEMRDLCLNNPQSRIGGRHARAFQEDDMTFYVEPEHYVVSNSPAWDPAYGFARHQKPFLAEMINMPEWFGAGGDGDPAVKFYTNPSASFRGHGYRGNQTHGSQHGRALVGLIMPEMRRLWNNPAYFEYHLRYLRELSLMEDPYSFDEDGTQRWDRDYLSQKHPWEAFNRAWTSFGTEFCYRMCMETYETLLAAPMEREQDPALLSSNKQYRVGFEIGAGRGIWSGWPRPTFAWQWQRSGPDGTWVDIAGASGTGLRLPRYTPVAADAGKYLRLKTVARQGEREDTAYSQPTPDIEPAVLAPKPITRAHGPVSGSNTVDGFVGNPEASIGAGYQKGDFVLVLTTRFAGNVQPIGFGVHNIGNFGTSRWRFNGAVLDTTFPYSGGSSGRDGRRWLRFRGTDLETPLRHNASAPELGGTGQVSFSGGAIPPNPHKFLKDHRSTPLLFVCGQSTASNHGSNPVLTHNIPGFTLLEAFTSLVDGQHRFWAMFLATGPVNAETLASPGTFNSSAPWSGEAAYLELRAAR